MDEMDFAIKHEIILSAIRATHIHFTELRTDRGADARWECVVGV